MNVYKVCNNNIIQIIDNSNRELVVMGKGIGFQKKPGDVIDQDKIKKYLH